MSEVETTMIDGAELNRQFPDTFHIPDKIDRCSLRVGDFAKIGLTCATGGERFWVKITRIEVEETAQTYFGAVDNHLVVFDIPAGEEIEFDADHVLQIIKNNLDHARIN